MQQNQEVFIIHYGSYRIRMGRFRNYDLADVYGLWYATVWYELTYLEQMGSV